MAYVSLYRKYRPQTFADVVGQDHVIRTLANAITEDRLHHAYLFTGPRGTGKTSTARILAKAINCEQGPTPEPCGTCEQCTSITDGSSVDVVELDMASHGGVDDARELRDRALFAPARAPRKVYILDEVHMASTAAFNALLKLVEEPPGHVLFAMATTDPQKVLPTIMSRVQRLDLRRVSAGEVADHVRRLCAAEGYRIDDGAVDAVVRAGDGSVRDTLSVLEQVLAFAGTDVTAEAVAQVLGQTPTERVVEAVDLLGVRDLAGLLALVQGLLDDGHDLRRFTLDLVQHLRDLLVLQVAPDRPDLVDATAERRRRLQAQTAALPREAMLRAVALLADTIAEQRQGSPRLPLELALARLATLGADGDVAALADRVARLEAGRPEAGRRPAGRPEGTRDAHERSSPAAPAASEPAAAAVSEPSRGPDPAPSEPPRAPRASSSPAPTVTSSPPVAPPVTDLPAPARPPVEEAEHGGGAVADPAGDADAGGVPDTAAPAAGVDDFTTLKAHWEGVLELVRQRSRRYHAIFLPATPTRLSRGILTLRYGQRYASFHADNARKGEFSAVLVEAVQQACDLRVRLEITVDGDDDRRRPLPPSVTPDDARTPVLDDDAPAVSDPSAAAEEQEVREAEFGGPRADLDVDALLARELDAALLEDRPAPGSD